MVTFSQNRKRINKLLNLNLETSLTKVHQNKAITKIFKITKVRRHFRYGLNCVRRMSHNDPDNAGFVYFIEFTSRLPDFVKNLFSIRYRLMLLNFQQKKFGFEYRKMREEQRFYNSFLRNINISIKYPFMGRKYIATKLPFQVQPDKFDGRLVRHRWLQPVFTNLNLILRRCHNGLRKPKARRV